MNHLPDGWWDKSEVFCLLDWKTADFTFAGGWHFSFFSVLDDNEIFLFLSWDKVCSRLPADFGRYFLHLDFLIRWCFFDASLMLLWCFMQNVELPFSSLKSIDIFLRESSSFWDRGKSVDLHISRESIVLETVKLFEDEFNTPTSFLSNAAIAKE